MSNFFFKRIATLLGSVAFASIPSGMSFAISPIQIRNVDESEVTISQADSTKPSELTIQTRILLARSKTLFDMGRYQDALTLVNKILEGNSANALAWELRGNSLHKLQQYNKALGAYDNALTILEGNYEKIGITASLWTGYPEAQIPAICSKYIKIEFSDKLNISNSRGIKIPAKKQGEFLW